MASIAISVMEWAFKLDLVSSLDPQIRAVVQGIGSVVIELVASWAQGQVQAELARNWQARQVTPERPKLPEN